MLTRLLLIAGLGAALSSSAAGVSASAQDSTVSSCPNANQYQARSYVDPSSNQVLYFLDILDASILPTTFQNPNSSFVVRANENSLDCATSFDNTATGYYGLELVTPTPAGLAAQYKTSLGGAKYCKQYSARTILKLEGGVSCDFVGGTSVSVYPPSSTGTSGSSTPAPTPLTCPTPDQYVATGSEVNGQLVYTLDIKDQATADLIASGAFRLFQYGNPQQGSDLGILGLTKADAAPAGFAARFTSTYGGLQAGVEYDGHAVLSLTDSTICSTNGVSVTVAATTTTTPPATGTSGSGSGSGSTTTPPTTTNPPTTTTPPSTGTTTTTPPTTGESNQPPTTSNPTPSNPTSSNPSPSGTFVPGSCPLFPVAQSVSRAGFPGSSAVLVAFANGDASANKRSIEWVDFHVSINSALTPGGSSVPAPQYNYRMQKTDATTFTLVFPTGTDDVQLADTDYLNYFFTYCSEMVDCDTEGFNFQPQPAQGESQVPAPSVVCPAVNFTQSATAVGSDGLTILFTEETVDRTVDWVDVHAIITSGTVNGQFNYRMAQSQSNPKQFVHSFPTAIDTVTVPSDAVVTYFFTYCSQKTDCNTDYFSLHRQPGTGALITSNEQCPVLQHESSAVRSTSNPSQLSLTFHPVNTQKTISWVDVHVSINTAMLADGQGALVPQYNYRMQKQANGDFVYAFPGADGVSVPETSYLSYFFTYCADLVDCNTEPETFGAVQAQRIAARVLAGDETSSNSTAPVVISASASSSTGVDGSKNATVIRPGFASSSTGVAGNSNNNNVNGNKNGAAAVAASSVLVFALAIGSALLM